MKRVKIMTIGIAAFLHVLAPAIAGAQIVNSGFETGALTPGWSSTGDALVDNSLLVGSTPTEGTYQALMTTLTLSADFTPGLSFSDAVSVNVLEGFLGVASGSLSGYGAVEGSAILQLFNANVGDTISFDWNFLTDEPEGLGDFSDFGFVVIDQTITVLADTNSPLLGGGSGFFVNGAGYQPFSHVLTTSGTHTIAFGVVDKGDNIGASSLLIDKVVLTPGQPSNQLPVAYDQSVSTDEDTPLSITLTATDPEGNPLTFSVVSGPSHGTLSGTASMLIYSPDGNYNGSDSFTFKANDGLADSNVATITITVNSVNDSPILASIGNKATNEGELLEFTITATDPDGDALTYSASNLPTGATFDPATQKFSWTPGYDQAGIYPDVLFTVTDNGSPLLSASEAITITVGNVNRPPVLDPIGNKMIDEDQLLTITLNANDPNGDTLTYYSSNLPSGAKFDQVTHIFTWMPTYDQAGIYPDVLFTVTDNGIPPASASETITITVGNVNRPPVLDPIGNKTIKEGQLLTIIITANDPDGDTLNYSASNLPSGATFDPTTRTFSWSPTYDQAENYPEVRFTVTDSGMPPASASEAITITVGNVNRPPVLDPIGNKNARETELLEFTITATDPDGGALTYSASNLPPGAAFDPVTQKFSWSPTYDQADTYSDIQFTVTDNGSPMELDFEVIVITVGNVNRAPVFTPVGTQSILENQLLQFYVTASDPDGDVFTYSTGPLPNGASFDAIGGLFSWTPDNTQAGTYPVVFYATDNGTPNMTGQLDVVINVGDVSTPCQLEDQIIQTVLSLNLPKSIENSYMANLKKVCRFVEEGKITPAINQLEAFINKVRTDISKGNISIAAGNNLINMAVNLINIIKS